MIWYDTIDHEVSKNLIFEKAFFLTTTTMEYYGHIEKKNQTSNIK